MQFVSERWRTVATIVVACGVGAYLRMAERLGVLSLDTAANGLPALPTRAAIEPRDMASFGALLLGALFFLLYLYRGRRFVLQWSRGWCYFAIAMFLLPAADPAAPPQGFMLAGAMLTMTGALTFLKSGESLRGATRSWPSVATLAAGPLLALALLHATVGRTAAFAVTNAALAMALGVACLHYCRLARDRRLVGAVVIGIPLAASATSHLVLAVAAVLLGQSPSWPLEWLITSLVCYTVAGFGMFVLVFEDIAAELQETNRGLHAAQAELRKLAVTDPLTGCYNRRHLEALTARELDRHRDLNMPLSLLFIDIDNFKPVNDTSGHDEGDRVLVEVARFLLNQVREFDLVFRWGGDEFLIVMACSAADAAQRAVLLKRSFADTLSDRNLSRTLGLSIGIVEVPPDVTNIRPLIRLADERMYLDKQGLPPADLAELELTPRGF